MKRILLWLDHNLEAVLMIILLAAATLIVFSQVIMRYAFEASLSWSEESARYLFIWLIYLGISYCAKHDRHIRVDLLMHVGFLSKLDKKLLCLLADIVFLGFALAIVWLGYEYTEKLFARNQKTASLADLPVWVVYAAIPVGYGLTAFRLLQVLWRRLRNFGDDEHFFDREDSGL